MEGITLYNGDCVKYLKDMEQSSVDLIVTDPPYEVEVTGGGVHFYQGLFFFT